MTETAPTVPPGAPSRRKEQAIRYVAALDGLRALAALGVLIIHTESAAKASITTYVFTGAVVGPLFMVFFAITGFVLYRGWARKHMAMGEPHPVKAKAAADGGADGRTLKFFLRRLARIYPLYWVVATAMLLLSNNTADHSVLDIIQVYLLLPFPNLDALVSLGLGIVVWTLIIDVVFYIYVTIHGPVVSAVVRRLRHRTTPFRIETTILLALSALILASDIWIDAPMAALVCLPVGMWFAVIEAEQDRLQRQLVGVRTMVRAWPVWIVLYFVGAPPVIWIAANAKSYDELIVTRPGVHMLLAFFGLLLLVNILWGKKNWPLQRFLNSKTVRTAGLLTYGTYLWHSVVLLLLDNHWPDAGMAVYQAVTLVGSVVLATITYLLLERPLARFRLDLRAPEPTPRTRS